MPFEKYSVEIYDNALSLVLTESGFSPIRAKLQKCQLLIFLVNNIGMSGESISALTHCPLTIWAHI